jgi:hypothetical protein
VDEPIVKPVSVMLAVESAAITDPLDNMMMILLEDGVVQVANATESFIQTIGVAELAKNP